MHSFSVSLHSLNFHLSRFERGDGGLVVRIHPTFLITVLLCSTVEQRRIFKVYKHWLALDMKISGRSEMVLCCVSCLLPFLPKKKKREE